MRVTNQIILTDTIWVFKIEIKLNKLKRNNI